MLRRYGGSVSFFISIGQTNAKALIDQEERGCDEVENADCVCVRERGAGLRCWCECW